MFLQLIQKKSEKNEPITEKPNSANQRPDSKLLKKAAESPSVNSNNLDSMITDIFDKKKIAFKQNLRNNILGIGTRRKGTGHKGRILNVLTEKDSEGESSFSNDETRKIKEDDGTSRNKKHTVKEASLEQKNINLDLNFKVQESFGSGRNFLKKRDAVLLSDVPEQKYCGKTCRDLVLKIPTNLYSFNKENKVIEKKKEPSNLFANLVGVAFVDPDILSPSKGKTSKNKESDVSFLNFTKLDLIQNQNYSDANWFNNREKSQKCRIKQLQLYNRKQKECYIKQTNQRMSEQKTNIIGQISKERSQSETQNSSLKKYFLNQKKKENQKHNDTQKNNKSMIEDNDKTHRKSAHTRNNSLPAINERDYESKREVIKGCNIVASDEKNNLKAFINFKPIEGIRPDTREMSAIVMQTNSKIWMYGGKSSDIFNDIWCYSIDKNTWHNPFLSKKLENSGRFGHTMVMHHKQLFIFGGEKRNLINNKLEVVSELRIFNTDKEDWMVTKNLGDIIEPRRNHCACIFGNFMMIIGGNQGLFSKLQSDIWAFDMFTHRWIRMRFENTHLLSRGLAYSSCCPVFKEEIIVKGLFSPTESNNINYLNPTIKEEGIFIFGGLTLDGASNDQYILKLGTRFPRIIVPKTKGQAPTPRFCHSMQYFVKMGFLIIYGGRNDLHEKTIALKDMYTLNTQHLVWTRVIPFGDKIPSVYNHSSCNSSSGIFLLGGVSDENYREINMVNIEFDPNKIKSLIRKKEAVKRGRPQSFSYSRLSNISNNNSQNNLNSFLDLN